MRYLALVTDYDGVVASDGSFSHSAVTAIECLRTSGRRAILVTGRRLDNLVEVCSHLSLFDYVVAENGAVLYEPRTRREVLLGKRPPDQFIECLKTRGVQPLEVGRVVVSTWLPHHRVVLDAIQEAGLELQIVFNRSAVMVLPCGITKVTGVDYALRRLGLSFHEVVAIGDAQNDHSFMEASECAVAVANALPSTRAIADIVTKQANGQGVAELIEQLLADDLGLMRGRVDRHLIPIGRRTDGTSLSVPPYGLNILIAGPSGTGKSTVASGIVEHLVEQNYQLCIIDPEGDYGTLQNVITVGNQRHAVTVSEVLAMLEDPKITLNVNLLGISLADRPEFFGQLFPHLQAMRTRTGRPHWIVLDEAHHMIPAEWSHLGHALPRRLGETILVTVHPDHLAPEVLSRVDAVIAVGPAPEKTIQQFASAIGNPITWPQGLGHERGKAVYWFPRKSEPPIAAEVLPGRAERIRHHRKYAEGNMRHRSFFFRGPDARHNLRAQNLVVFAQIAEGIDQDTWLFHLRRGDYSRWFRNSVKDKYLGDQAERIERRHDLDPGETRQLIRGLIEARYTLPD